MLGAGWIRNRSREETLDDRRSSQDELPACVRCVDFEQSCQADDPEDKATFEKNTRAMSSYVMLYQASVDQAWAPIKNHERISHESLHVMQARTKLAHNSP